MNDTITEITEEKSRVKVVVNGEETLWFSHLGFNERPLCVGDSVDLEELKEWLLIRQYPEALNKAVAFLAVRARSIFEVRQKLLAKGYMERTLDMVLYKLEKEHIVDDEAFARDWARARTNCRLGKIRILQELLHKGIDRELAEQALAELDEEEDSEKPIHKLALKLLARVKNEPDARKAMRKVLSAMARRGFSYQESSEAVQTALAELGEEAELFENPEE